MSFVSPSLLLRNVQLFGISVTVFLFSTSASHADVVADGTLGREKSVVNNLPQGNSITGGALRGNNLFHSFSQFNIDSGQLVEFPEQLGVENIFSRVTGSDPSSLMGTLKVGGSSNLYFLNPNGVIFGQGSSIDMKGSLVVTTANQVVFPNGQIFSTSNPETPSILTVNIPAPIGVQFEGSPAGISVQNSSLSSDPGATISLIGGNINLSNSHISSVGIGLTSVASPGAVKLSSLGNRIETQPSSNNMRMGDISIEKNSSLDSAGNANSIKINAGNLNINNNSHLESVATSQDAEGIDIGLSGKLSIADGSFIRSTTAQDAQGGNISIRVDSFFASGYSIVSSNSQLFSSGATGNIDISVNDTLSLSNRSSINTNANYIGVGKPSGSISITSSSINLDNSFVNTFVYNYDGNNTSKNPGSISIAILNDLLGRIVLMNFRKIELSSISKKFKKYFDSRERLT